MNYQNDPLLGAPRQAYQSPAFADFERQQELLNRKMEEMRHMQQASSQQPAQSLVWDEIDTISSSLSDTEFEYLANNEEFKESSATIQALLQREYMRIMRPIVESTKDGKDTLDKHLTLIKRLRKSVKEEANKKDALMNEYITKYANIPWQDFIAMKQGKQIQNHQETQNQ
ncbi:MAG: hypothetical protein NC048_10415 [Bacteroides sp.]|nr:hypothetical protein [Bacteroides sp.]